jgi:hypothetical protein
MGTEFIECGKIFKVLYWVKRDMYWHVIRIFGNTSDNHGYIPDKKLREKIWGMLLIILVTIIYSSASYINIKIFKYSKL